VPLLDRPSRRADARTDWAIDDASCSGEKVIDGRTPKNRHPCRTVVRCTDRIGVALVFLGSWLSGYFIVATAGLLGVRRGLAHRAGASSFLASAAYLAGMLASAAFGVHPFVLPAIGDARHALTVDNAAAPGAGLRIGLAWWVPGMLLAVAYCAYTCRRLRGKVTLEGEGY
jgi:cytochrome bd-type quinol oxidase subunit 2